MFKIYFLLILAVAAYSSGDDDEFFFYHDYVRTPLGDDVDRASIKLLKEAFSAAEDKNVIASPLGVLMLLSMYSAGARENEGIKNEIIRALGSSNYDNLHKSYSLLSDRFSSMNADYLTLANKLYVDEKYELGEEFSNKAVNSYHSEVERVRLSDPESAATIINRWSDEKTKGHIKDPVSKDIIDPDAAAVLVNVIFFQGHWSIPFNSSETEEKDFHLDRAKTIKKPMMHLVQPLLYHESSELGARMVELPYKEKGFRMVVILPNEVDGLPSVLEKMDKRGLLSDIFSLTPTNRDVILDMPKFEIQSSLDLKSLLPKVGVSKIFYEPATGIVKDDAVIVDEAFQKAFVKVDEEGATAGAFTGAVMVPMSLDATPPPAMEFNVNHPFLFAILHEDVMLFAGTYTH